jgi:hypothetical protein
MPGRAAVNCPPCPPACRSERLAAGKLPGPSPVWEWRAGHAGEAISDAGSGSNTDSGDKSQFVMSGDRDLCLCRRAQGRRFPSSSEIGAMARGEQRAMMAQRWSLAMAELHVVGLSGTSWDMIQEMRRADQARSGTTDATRTERGFHAATNGESAGQRPQGR